MPANNEPITDEDIARVREAMHELERERWCSLPSMDPFAFRRPIRKVPELPRGVERDIACGIRLWRAL